MGQVHHDMIRLSLDIPAEQHVHLKMLAIRKEYLCVNTFWKP